LGYAALFTPTFRELAQGESAVNGQALLSKLPIRSLHAFLFRAQTAFWKPQRWIPNWPVMQRRTGGAGRGSRRGRHRVDSLQPAPQSCGGTARMGQLEETLADARRYGPDFRL